MKSRFFRIPACLLAAVVLTGSFNTFARKTGYKLNYSKPSTTDTRNSQMSRGSFMVASQCTDCNNGYTLEQIAFSGFDKPQSSTTETFFITNNTDRTMSGVALYIEYTTLDGRQLNKRYVKLACDIPPGETRQASLDSWDKQKSFYAEHSTPSRHAGTPFHVIFDPISYYLRF